MILGRDSVFDVGSARPKYPFLIGSTAIVAGAETECGFDRGGVADDAYQPRIASSWIGNRIVGRSVSHGYHCNDD
jgi:hypothetical protein